MKKTAKNGMTFLEITIVIAIMGVVILMVPPFFVGFIYQGAVSDAVFGLSAELRRAQAYSMAGRLGRSWGVAYDGGSLILFAGDNYAGRDPALDEKIPLNPNIAITDFRELSFQKITGYSPATAEIIVTAGAVEKKLTINSQGIVSEL